MTEDRITLSQCRERSKIDNSQGASFVLCGFGKRTQCEWVDAHVGSFRVSAHDGVVMVDELIGLGFWCEGFRVNDEK